MEIILPAPDTIGESCPQMYLGFRALAEEFADITYSPDTDRYDFRLEMYRESQPRIIKGLPGLDGDHPKPVDSDLAQEAIEPLILAVQDGMSEDISTRSMVVSYTSGLVMPGCTQRLVPEWHVDGQPGIMVRDALPTTRFAIGAVHVWNADDETGVINLSEDPLFYDRLVLSNRLQTESLEPNQIVAFGIEHVHCAGINKTSDPVYSQFVRVSFA